MLSVVLLRALCEINDPPRFVDPPASVFPRSGWSLMTREEVLEQRASQERESPGRTFSFRITEFAELNDGRRVTVREDRGFSGKTSSGDPWQWFTRASLTQDVLGVTAPEDDDLRPEREWVIDRLRELDIVVDPASVEEAPYRVEFENRVLERLRE